MKNSQTDNSNETSPIPLFALYGESGAIEDPGFVHIENIFSRSSLHGWVIRPHRHGRMFQTICMYRGAVEVQLDETVHRLEHPCAITLPPGAVHGFRFAPDTEGRVLTLAEPMLTGEHYSRCAPYFAPLFERPHTFALEAPLLGQLQQLLEQIECELNRSDTGRALMCEWLSRAALMTLRRQLDQQGLASESGSTPSNTLVGFRRLIENHFREHWTIERYADALGTSPARLNRLCKRLLGKTAKTLPQERLLLEAKRRLIYTSSNLDEIAYALGFQDPAYFSRFFKRTTGVTAGRFRSDNNFDTTQESP
ncbi:AraC family transcriptional regulator [Marinobacterium nitratireducens]|uniref:AraC family transcriptional regulator n=1 Tax=Marinobacterium nitratireducens TaxID=518897 RepID=A0A918DY13_9GAMM|nr:helix-turn-helix domain-containing protein [Marinobacterium nitratireducens]GGO87418.1 AraC family transcriptional regulator [Marinobacterium nitratireducens]